MPSRVHLSAAFPLFRLLVLGLLCATEGRVTGQTFPDPEQSADYFRQEQFVGPDTSRIESLKSFLEWENTFQWLDVQPSSMPLTGEISVGYEFGFPSDYYVYRPLSGGYSVNGQLRMTKSGLPVKALANYTQYTTRPETQNFFRIEFDRDAFRESLEKKKNESLDEIGKKQAELREQGQLSERKLAYWNHANRFKLTVPPSIPLNSSVSDDLLYGNDVPSVSDISGMQTYNLPDSIQLSKSSDPDKPVLSSPQVADSLSGKGNDLHSRRQKVLEKRQQAQNEYANIHRKAHSLRQYEEMVRGGSTPKELIPKQKGWRNHLKNLEKMELGQTNPSYSYFLLSGVPVNGGNFAYNSTQREINFTHGQVITSPFFMPDQRQRWIRDIVQDMVPVSGNIGDRITAGSVSIWKREGSVIRFGSLYGIDKFLGDGSAGSQTTSRLPARNVVSELSGEVKIGGNGSVEFAYAKSVYNDPSARNENGSGSTSAFEQRSSAGLLRGEYAMRKAKTKINGSVQLVQPEFRSLGMPYLRDDNFRLDVGLSKQFGSKAEINVTSRRQHNNLQGDLPYTQFVRMWMLGGKWRISKKWQVNALFIPVRSGQAATRSEDNYLTEFNQWTLTSVYTQRKRDRFSVITSTLNYYDAPSPESHIRSLDVLTALSVDWGQRRGNVLQLKYTETTGIDSLWAGKVISVSDDFMFQATKNIHILSGITMLKNHEMPMNMGFRAGMKWQITKTIHFQIDAQRIVVEQFFSPEVLTLYQKFPYRCSAYLNILF